MSNKLMVTKSNALIKACYRLSLNETQIIMYAISLINPLDKEIKRDFEIDIKAFAKMFNKTHTKLYHDIKQVVTKKLWNREIRYVVEVATNTIEMIRWVDSIKYCDKKGFLEINFSEKIAPYLHHLSKQFTTYNLVEVVKFKSAYSHRIYEYLLMQLNQSRKNEYSFKIKIDDLKYKFRVTEQYTRFSNFRARVLEAAQTEINKFSNLEMQYKIIKRGRSPYEIEFIVQKKVKVKQEHEVKVGNNEQQNKVKVPLKTIEQAKNMARKAGTGWDVYYIVDLFYDDVKEKGIPYSIEAAFIGKVKKCIKYKA